MRTQWSHFGAFIFSPKNNYPFAKKLPHHHQSPASSSVAPTSYWFTLLLDLLTYLAATVCCITASSIRRGGCANSMDFSTCHAVTESSHLSSYLPRSFENFSRNLEKLSLYFITCHVVPRAPSHRQPFSFIGETSKFKTELGFGAFQSPEVRRKKEEVNY
jgi:hypothetical protein